MNQVLNDIIDKYSDEMITNLQKLIRIKSISGERDGDAPFGKGVQEAFDFAADLARQKGFEVVNYDNYAEEFNFGDGSEAVGVMCHLDTVPVDEEKWDYPPFGAEIHNGRMYGRGTSDNKGCLVACLYACLAIKESGLPISKKITQVLGTCEEKGEFPCIRYYIEHTNVPSCGIIPDSWFPLAFAEKGILSYNFRKEIAEDDSDKHIRLVGLNAGTAYNVVSNFAEIDFLADEEGVKTFKKIAENIDPDSQMTISFLDSGNIKVCFEGRSAHASTPELGVNAASALLRFIKSIDFAPIDLKQTLDIYASQFGNDYLGEGLHIASEDKSGYLTNNLGILKYENGSLLAGMNIRSPISFTIDKLEQSLSSQAEISGSMYERIYFSEGFCADVNEELPTVLLNVYRDITGDMESQPKAHGGGSYARILKNFLPFGPSFQSEELMFHKENEYIDCERYILLGKIYANALYELAK